MVNFRLALYLTIAMMLGISGCAPETDGVDLEKGSGAIEKLKGQGLNKAENAAQQQSPITGEKHARSASTHQKLFMVKRQINLDFAAIPNTFPISSRNFRILKFLY